MPRWLKVAIAGLFVVGAAVAAGCKSDVESKCASAIEAEFKNIPRELEAKAAEKKAKMMEGCKKLAIDEVDCFNRDFRKANEEKCRAAKQKMKGVE